MSKRDLSLIFAGFLLGVGIVIFLTGLILKENIGSYVQSKYLPPVFAIPKEVNRDFSLKLTSLVNTEREKNGLEPLTESNTLDYSAYIRVKQIINSQNFTHYATESGDIKAQQAVDVVGYQYKFVGENLARGYNDPGLVVEGWMDSPKHKENILNGNYKETGIVVVEGLFQGSWENIIVLLLGEPI